MPSSILGQARRAGNAEARERYDFAIAQAAQCWADEAEGRYQEGIYEGRSHAPSRLRWLAIGVLCGWLSIGWTLL